MTGRPGARPAEPPPAPSSFDWAVRAEIYRSFAERGAAPGLDRIAGALGVVESEVRAALQVLYSAHEIAPRPDGAGVWMANPFSAVPTEFPVETPHMSCWANCAWDALGVPAILATDARIRTRCATSGAPIEISVRDGRLEGDEGVVHLLTPLRHAWDDIGFT